MATYTPEQLREIADEGAIIESLLDTLMESMRVAASLGEYSTYYSNSNASQRLGIQSRLQNLGYSVINVSGPPMPDVPTPAGFFLKINWNDDTPSE